MKKRKETLVANILSRMAALIVREERLPAMSGKTDGIESARQQEWTVEIRLHNDRPVRLRIWSNKEPGLKEIIHALFVQPDALAMVLAGPRPLASEEPEAA